MTEVLGTLFNPYAQAQTPDFGGNSPLPVGLSAEFKHEKGNRWDAMSPLLQYPPTTRLPTTMTKAGASHNRTPTPLPAGEINIKRPQYSAMSHALIEQPRVGLQLGMADMYRDDPYADWNSGISYYTIYTGVNPKQFITPVIYPQAWRASEWTQPTVNFPQINRQDTEDITDLTLDNRYSCTLATLHPPAWERR